MFKINLYKIMFILQRDNYIVNTGELASLTKINYKNIGRYLNLLVEQDLIEREIDQDKKKRFILNSLTWKGRRFVIPQFYWYFLKNLYGS